MKRTISITSILLVALLICTSWAKGAYAVRSYKPLLYGNSVGGDGDSKTPRYKGDAVEKLNFETKKNMDSVKIELFGNSLDLKYYRSVTSNQTKTEYNYYTCNVGGNEINVAFNQST